jgi:TetR/AcrR family transcriptional repressor of nem operon
MARPRTFDPNDVLDTARELFWRKGYQGTSFDDLTAETGLTKPSLYAAFGDKASLFLKVLDRYHETVLSRSAKALSGALTGEAAIEAWLTGFVGLCSGETGFRGCLSVNTATDGSIDDRALENSIARFNARLEKLVLSRLHADRAQFSDDFEPAATARTIMAIYFGLMVMAKQQPSSRQVRAIISQVKKLFA